MNQVREQYELWVRARVLVHWAVSVSVNTPFRYVIYYGEFVRMNTAH